MSLCTRPRLRHRRLQQRRPSFHKNRYEIWLLAMRSTWKIVVCLARGLIIILLVLRLRNIVNAKFLLPSIILGMLLYRSAILSLLWQYALLVVKYPIKRTALAAWEEHVGMIHLLLVGFVIAHLRRLRCRIVDALLRRLANLLFLSREAKWRATEIVVPLEVPEPLMVAAQCLVVPPYPVRAACWWIRWLKLVAVRRAILVEVNRCDSWAIDGVVSVSVIVNAVFIAISARRALHAVLVHILIDGVDQRLLWALRAMQPPRNTGLELALMTWFRQTRLRVDLDPVSRRMSSMLRRLELNRLVNLLVQSTMIRNIVWIIGRLLFAVSGVECVDLSRPLNGPFSLVDFCLQRVLATSIRIQVHVLY